VGKVLEAGTRANSARPYTECRDRDVTANGGKVLEAGTRANSARPYTECRDRDVTRNGGKVLQAGAGVRLFVGATPK